MKSENKFGQNPSFGSKSNGKPNTKTTLSKYRQLLRKPRRKTNSYEPKNGIGQNKEGSTVRPGADKHIRDSNYLATDISDDENWRPNFEPTTFIITKIVIKAGPVDRERHNCRSTAAFISCGHLLLLFSSQIYKKIKSHRQRHV